MEINKPRGRPRSPKATKDAVSFRPAEPVRELLDAAREADEDVSAIINATLTEHGKSVASRLAQERFRRALRFQEFPHNYLATSTRMIGILNLKPLEEVIQYGSR